MKRLLLLSGLCCLLLSGCNSGLTLQKYFVESSENRNFTLLDLSPNLLINDQSKLSAEQKKALQSFEKMNVLAFKVTSENKAQFETECAKVKTILKDKKYQQLMRYGSGKEGASVSFVGDDEHIDEFVLFADKKENGFAIVRILGKDMNPTGIATMLSILRDSNINLDQLKPLEQMMSR